MTTIRYLYSMLSEKWHRHIFLFGLIALGAGMLFGTVPTSIPQAILGANWLIEKNYAAKWQQLKSNKIFWVLVSLFVLHVLGMMYTENTMRGMEDIKTKLPLIVLPIIFLSTKPLNKNEFKLLFNFIFLAVVVSSVCCFIVYLGYTKKIIVDVRQASVFMSHIRFSLFISFTIIALFYFAITEKQISYKLASIIAIPWLLFFMYKLEMATGFLILSVVGPLLFLIYAFKHLPKFVTVSLILLGGSIVFWAVKQMTFSTSLFEKNPTSQANVLLEKSTNGRVYLQDTVYGFAENGNLIAINICDAELMQEWPKRSSIPFDGIDKKGNSLRYTLLRYMTSKGLTKDSVGIWSLNNEDIRHIENGVSNYLYPNTNGLKNRWRELVWEYVKYKKGENPSGHTLTMRLEFWKTGLYVLNHNLLFGVGTGDIQDAYNKAYNETNSKLDKDWRLRCHNQYLAISVAFGLMGLIIFVFYLIWPAVVLRKELHYLFWPFWLIALLSFTTEDTLETQSGVTFFIFYFTLFLWLASYKSKSSSSEN